MLTVFHIVEAQGQRQLKGNWNSPEFKCEIGTPAQALLKGMVLPQSGALSGGPSLPT